MHCLDLIRGCSGFLFQLFSIISVSQLELGILQRAVLCPQGRAHKSQGEKSSAGGSRVQPASLRRTVSLTGFHSSRIKKKNKIWGWECAEDGRVAAHSWCSTGYQQMPAVCKINRDLGVSIAFIYGHN